MTHIKRNSKKGKRYQFRGMTFQIAPNELARVVRQARALHERLVDALMGQAQGHVERYQRRGFDDGAVKRIGEGKEQT